ncbi:four helix bundle protein [Patescibacteria group bacterium]
MKKISSYQDLKVWQKGHFFLKDLIIISKKIPYSLESGIIKKQLIRSGSSVVANIVEGFAGHRGKSYKNYLIISRRSATETDYWLFLLRDLKLLRAKDYRSLVSQLKEVIAMLTAIINKLP